jgi:hypothetical protein
MLSNALLCLLIQRLVPIIAVYLRSEVADVSECTICRGEEYFAELIKVKIAIIVGIKFPHNQVRISRLKLDEVLLQELKDFFRVYLSIIVAVYSLENSNGFKVDVHGDALSLHFNLKQIAKLIN